jgi:hypothetical protein
VYRKVILAFLLVINYSLAFGAIEAAAMPDEQHPLGKAIQHHHHHHLHADQHSHDHNNLAGQDGKAQQQTADDVHDHQHKHGINIQLNMDIPGLLALDFYRADSPPVTRYRLDLNSLSYAPAVPPPNRL